MKTVVKTKSKELSKTEEVKEERKVLKECFVLWRNESKSGNHYLKGYTPEEVNGGISVVGYFNSKKKNPKEPDIRVYEIDSEGKQGNEIAALWENISKNDKRYLTGSTNDKEDLVGFYGDEKHENRPYIKVYFQED